MKHQVRVLKSRNSCTILAPLPQPEAFLANEPHSPVFTHYSTHRTRRSQITASQLMESKYSLLQARVEHLELDLSFKAIASPLGDSLHSQNGPPRSNPAKRVSLRSVPRPGPEGRSAGLERPGPRFAPVTAKCPVERGLSRILLP